MCCVQNQSVWVLAPALEPTHVSLRTSASSSTKMVCVAVRYRVPTLLLLGDTRSSSRTFSTWKRKRNCMSFPAAVIKGVLMWPPRALINTPCSQTRADYVAYAIDWRPLNKSKCWFKRPSYMLHFRRGDAAGMWKSHAGRRWLNHRYQSRGYLWHSDMLHQRTRRKEMLLDFRRCPSAPVDRTCVPRYCSVLILKILNM